MRLHRLASTIAVSALALAAVPAVAAVRSSTPATVWDAIPASYGIVDHAGLSTLTRTGIANLDKATDLGPAPAGQVMSVDLVLAHPHASQEQAYAESIYDKSSPNFHHYLTPATYAAMFGVPKSATAAATSWLTKGHLSIASVAGAGDIIQASGTIARIDALFRTDLGRFRDTSGEFIANRVAPVVPTALHVAAVIGLNTKQKATVDDSAAELKKAGVAVPGARPAVAGETNDGPFDPNTMAKIYDQPAANTGQGQTAGVFISSQMAPVISDLRTYELDYKLGTHPVRVIPEGKGPITTNYGGDEWNLDTSAIVGMAPGIKEMDYYDAASLYDVDLLPDFANWRDDPHAAQQVDASFGECEQNPGYQVFGDPTVNSLFFNGLGNNTEPQYETVLRAAAMMGHSLFSSAGDTGGACPSILLPGLGAVNGVENNVIPLQNYPAASPWNVAVGGTDIQATDKTLSTRQLEYAEPTSGGGPSAFLAAQPWQSAVYNTPTNPQAVGQPCVVDELGNPCTATFTRGVPDVSALYGGLVATGYDSEEYHQVEAVGGTSLSSPLNVGMWTRVQATAPTSAGYGFAPPAFYGAYAKDPSSFYDVTVGSNGQRTAGPGYDYVTGLGVQDGVKLMTTLAGHVTPTVNAGIPAVPTPSANPCTPVFNSFAGNASDPLNPTSAVPGTPALQDAALDITKGDIKSSSDGKNLVITLAGPTLSPSLPPNLAPYGADFDMAWTFNGKKYGAVATVSASGVITYEAGKFTGATIFGGYIPGSANVLYDSYTPVEGSFGEGLLTMTVPVSLVGNPKAGDRLQYPLGFDESGELGPAFGELVVDAGADQDYVLGSACTGGAANDNGKTLTIVGSKPAVRYGQKLTLSGRLTIGGVPQVGVKLTLKDQRRDKKTKTLKTVTTDKDGRWSYTFKPSYDETYSITGSGLTAKVKIPTTLSFPQLRGVSRKGVLSVSGSVSPGYKLGGTVKEFVSIYRLDKKLKPIKLLGRVAAGQLVSRKGSPLGVNRFSLTTSVPHGNYTVGISVSTMPLNTGAIAARFSVRV